MPLVLVSVDYLRSCQATVYFLKESLNETDQFDRKDCFLGECDFPDGGEDEHEAGPYTYLFDSIDEGHL